MVSIVFLGLIIVCFCVHVLRLIVGIGATRQLLSLICNYWCSY